MSAFPNKMLQLLGSTKTGIHDVKVFATVNMYKLCIKMTTSFHPLVGQNCFIWIVYGASYVAA